MNKEYFQGIAPELLVMSAPKIGVTMGELISYQPPAPEAPVLTTANKLNFYSLQKEVFEKENLQELLSSSENGKPTVVDEYELMMTELFEIRNPHGTSEELKNFLEMRLQDKDYQGLWLHRPWDNKLVHLPERSEYLELIFARNFPNISKEDQKKLGQQTVAILGGSVGSKGAVEMAKIGIQHVIIADRDTQGISNMARTANSDIARIGEEKTALVVEEILKFNPYARVEVYPFGIDESNMHEIIRKSDIVIDEMDDVVRKYKTRLMARQANIPVLMGTDIGFNPTISLELDHDKLFGHGLNKKALKLLMSTKFSKDLTGEEKIGLVIAMIGKNNIPASMYENFAKIIKGEVYGFSQLGFICSITAGNLSEYVLELTRGNYEKLRRFTKIPTANSSLTSLEILKRKKEDIIAQRRFFQEHPRIAELNAA